MNKRNLDVSWPLYIETMQLLGNVIQTHCSMHHETKPPKFVFEYVTGPPRGGLIPAVYFSHAFGIPYIQLDQAVSKSVKNVLVVDDIVDTGETTEQLHNLPGWIVAAMYYKPQASFKPLYAREVYNDVWVVFPYETERVEDVDR